MSGPRPSETMSPASKPADWLAALNRRAEIEQEMMDVSKAKIVIPLQWPHLWALRLGTAKELWHPKLKEHALEVRDALDLAKQSANRKAC